MKKKFLKLSKIGRKIPCNLIILPTWLILLSNFPSMIVVVYDYTHSYYSLIYNVSVSINARVSH